jgi:hypothetical protein
MRGLLMALFARARDEARGYQTFDAHADEEMKRRLGATLPQYDAASLATALGRMLEIVDHDLEVLTEGRVQLSAAQARVLRRVRARRDG